MVIQEMVDAECSGVLFSRDPISGNPAKILITSNFGLGESVVSASADPDSIVVSNDFWKEDGNGFRILEKKVGSKQFQTIQFECGVRERKVDKTQAAKMSVSDNQALRLAKLGVSLEERFGTPRDIEFSIVEDEVFVLQSRPVTTLHSWTDNDLLHEFDMPINSKINVCTKANVGEVIPGALSVLGICTIFFFIFIVTRV